VRLVRMLSFCYRLVTAGKDARLACSAFSFLIRSLRLSNSLEPYCQHFPPRSLVVLTENFLAGAELCQAFRSHGASTALIVVIDPVKPHDVDQILKHGVTDFLIRPVRPVDVLPLLRRAVDSVRRRNLIVHSQNALKARRNGHNQQPQPRRMLLRNRVSWS
jgi:DNA-binding NarL/FixJ family response regulator